MARRKRTGLIQVKLRISGDLKRRLDIEAKKREDGSLSAEIADRLEQSFKLPAMEETVATAVVNKLSIAGWGPPASSLKKGDKQ
jgi:hypothetical protein